MQLKKIEKPQPVEILVFDVKPELVDEFIRLDHEYWTEYLAKQPGFISKEVWVSDTKKGMITTIIFWNTMKEWKDIPVSELMEQDRLFTEKMGAENFKMVGAEHENNQYYKCYEYK